MNGNTFMATHLFSLFSSTMNNLPLRDQGEVCKAEVLIVAEELEAKHSRYLTAHRSRPKHSKVQLESSANISQGSFRVSDSHSC